MTVTDVDHNTHATRRGYGAPPSVRKAMVRSSDNWPQTLQKNFAVFADHQVLIANNKHATVIAIAYEAADPLLQGDDRLKDLHHGEGLAEGQLAILNAFL